MGFLKEILFRQLPSEEAAVAHVRVLRTLVSIPEDLDTNLHLAVIAPPLAVVGEAIISVVLAYLAVVKDLPTVIGLEQEEVLVDLYPELT
jgi:hypothetical protein